MRVGVRSEIANGAQRGHHLGCPARIFNAGNKRRQEGNAGVQANFFDASNLDAKAQRERMAMETLDEVLEWLQHETQPDSGCAAGIFDATNTTKERRENVRQVCVWHACA